jgi:integrase
VEQGDIDYQRNYIHIQRSDWEGHLTTPKSGRSRKIDVTERLRAALKKARHLRGDRVLWRDDGFPKVTQVLLAKWMSRGQDLAGVEVTGGIHILRHTFCSRLAMAGAPALAIKELAGHQSLATTQRYMHLSPKAKESAVKLLEGVRFDRTPGDIMETAQGSVKNP